MAEAAPKLSKVPTQEATITATLTAALVGLAALLPGKIAPAAMGMAAPFLSEGIMWIAREWAKEWLADRKAQAATRLAERYLNQMEKQYKKLPPNDSKRPPLLLKINELADRIHQHKMSQLILLPPVPAAAPPTE